jgi:hypothetical protein
MASPLPPGRDARARSGVQFALRCNGNLAFIHCDWRLAAQRDSALPRYRCAWVDLLAEPTDTAAGDPTQLSSQRKPLYPDNVVVVELEPSMEFSVETVRTAVAIIREQLDWPPSR